MIIRTEALEVLGKHRTDEVVITTMRTAREWPYFSNNDDLDFGQRYTMGEAPSFGLGVALARPDRRVWVLNGDGSQLMNLGILATIANARAKNLVLFVFENGQYEVTGGQPIPLAWEVDFAAAAKGLGFASSYSFEDLPTLEASLGSILKAEGPTFVTLKVVPGEKLPDRGRKGRDEFRKLSRSLAAGSPAG